MALSSSKHCPRCGSDHKGKPFALYEDGWHCFSCGSSKRAIRNFRTTTLRTTEELEMPEHTLNPSMFSLPVLKWLRSYHVTDDMIYRYNIAEASDNSIITPVIEDDRVVMYQRRWLTTPRRIMTYGHKQPFLIRESRTDKTLVVVEDFISAIRVAESVDSYCMFGTAVPYEQLKQLVKMYDTVVIWADGDAPGQKAAHKLIATLNRIMSYEIRNRAFSLYTKKVVRNVLTDRDPKCYTNTEIRTILQTQGACNEIFSR